MCCGVCRAVKCAVQCSIVKCHVQHSLYALMKLHANIVANDSLAADMKELVVREMGRVFGAGMVNTTYNKGDPLCYCSSSGIVKIHDFFRT